jgi:hypothetical protein
MAWSQDEAKDLLFISTERYKFCVLEYDTATGAQFPACSPPASAASIDAVPQLPHRLQLLRMCRRPPVPPQHFLIALIHGGHRAPPDPQQRAVQ